MEGKAISRYKRFATYEILPLLICEQGWTDPLLSGNPYEFRDENRNRERSAPKRALSNGPEARQERLGRINFQIGRFAPSLQGLCTYSSADPQAMLLSLIREMRLRCLHDQGFPLNPPLEQKKNCFPGCSESLGSSDSGRTPRVWQKERSKQR